MSMANWKRDPANLKEGEWRSHADRRQSAERRRPNKASPAMACLFQDAGSQKKPRGFPGPQFQ
jgi:hypothetical protein